MTGRGSPGWFWVGRDLHSHGIDWEGHLRALNGFEGTFRVIELWKGLGESLEIMEWVGRDLQGHGMG